MRNMSNGFYNYIAKITVNFFQSMKETIRPGERYCLWLDTEDMVKAVDEAIRSYARLQEIDGTYVYSPDYTTFTIRLTGGLELVVASKMNGMTDGFLVKLRNAQLTDKRFPILIIAYDPNDSITSGTCDLSSDGMPFHVSALINRIQEDIHRLQLPPTDERLLRYELDRKKADRFSDQSSIYSYSDLLTVLDQGFLAAEDYHAFGLLEDPEGKGLVDAKKIEERLALNHKHFDRIDWVVKHGNIENELDKEYDKGFLDHLARCKQTDIPWDQGQTLQAVIRSQGRIEKKLDNPLEILEDTLSVYSDSMIEYSFPLDELVFMKDDGNTSAKRRNKNILIYNPEHRANVTITLSTNIAVKSSWLQCVGAEVFSSARSISITMKPSGCSFSKTTVTDATNQITYNIKVCVLDVCPHYLETIQTSYLLSVSKYQKSCAIQVLVAGKTLLINPDQPNQDEAFLKDQGIYTCNFDHTLSLSINEESIPPDSDRCSITLQCGSVGIPLQIRDESPKAEQLTGMEALRRKFRDCKRLEYRDGRLVSGTSAYYIRNESFKEALSREDWILQNQALAADLNIDGLIDHPLQISDSVRQAYLTLLQAIRSRRQLPSLVSYSGEVKAAAEAYVQAVMAEFSSIPQGRSLEESQSDLLLLGCVIQKYDEGMIMMSPLHPLNVQYQLTLLHEKNVGDARDQILEKMTPLNLIPYIRNEKHCLYYGVEQTDSPEWRFYAQASNKRYQGARNFVEKLVEDKIREYQKNFPFLFEEIGNRQFRINLVNMGDCKEVLQGLIRHYRQQLNQHIPPEKLDEFTINIYGDRSAYNEFFALGSQNKLRELIQNYSRGIDVSEMALILADKLKCYFRDLNEEAYEYAHLTFYEMNSSDDLISGRMENIPTGVSMGGLTSGVPSVLDGSWYKTGFGARYAPKNDLLNMAARYNALHHVAFLGSAYNPEDCIFTEIEKGQEIQLRKIYKASNWVVFVSPKVDLSFFQKKQAGDEELMIIHYSDQYTSSNGYDDITVTQKSKQYREIIFEQIQKRNVSANSDEIDGIINLFNAINGNWLLKLISTEKPSGVMDSYFSREKMSNLSAIKLCMAYYSNDSVIWVPISLEEILRVSGAVGLSREKGLLSSKNLGFPNGPTCDDILMVGIEAVSGGIKLYLHPVEVKIGLNFSAVTEKARQQALNTYEGFWNSLWPDEGRDSLECRATRNFFIQLVLTCCEKMKLYGIEPSIPWDLALVENREALLSERYSFSRDLDAQIGKGTIVSFKADVHSPSVSEENGIVLLEFPEKAGADYMVKTVSEIKDLLQNFQADSSASDESESHSQEAASPEAVVPETEENAAPEEPPATSMEICFGTDLGTGQPLYWHPNDTNQIFHTNTGIIGTMGTGKTQFTKSMITQLYRDQARNFLGSPLGILIFDYKGDYNETKTDFIQMTVAKILKPYHLPFNPLALTKSKVFRPLLPVHTANAFKDTLSKVYALGPKQQNTLFNCIMDAYNSRGISADRAETWDCVPPTFESVYNVYNGNDEIKKTDSLAAAMDKLHRFQIFEGDPGETVSLFELLKGVVVVDLSGYDSDIQSLIVAITLDLFYAQMQAAGSSRMGQQYRELTKLILVDEADNFMSEGFPALKKILKEGREFGVGTILSTQFLKHFGSGEDDYSKYILTWVVHSVADLKLSDVEFVFKTETKSPETSKLFHDIKSLQKHHSIIKIGNASPRYVKDKAFWELYQELGEMQH